MNLISDEKRNIQIISTNETLELYKKFEMTFSVLNDKMKMCENVDFYTKVYNELTSYNYNSFNSSCFAERFQENLKLMKNTINGPKEDFKNIQTHYQAARECEDIYKRYISNKKGDSNE